MVTHSRASQIGLLCGLLCLTACGTPQREEGGGGTPVGGDDLVAEGQEAFRKCAACHCATDPAVTGDEDWLKMNETTACISAGESTPQVRKALNAYLRSEGAIRPLRIDEAYAPKEGLAHGSVSLPEFAGSAFLKAEGHQVARGAPAKIRLHWQAGAEGRALKLPAGTYRVISYALYARDKKDAARRWMMTATNINGCLDVVVDADKTVPLELQPVFWGVLSGESVEGGMKIFLRQTDRYDNVATLSVDGDVRLPDYVVLDAKGQKIHSAVFENT